MTCSNPNCQAHVVGSVAFAPLSPEWSVLYEAYKREAQEGQETIKAIIEALRAGLSDSTTVTSIYDILIDRGYDL